MIDLLAFLSAEVKKPQGRFYRRDLLKAIALSYPPNTWITGNELNSVLGYSPTATGLHSMMKRMKRDGEINYNSSKIGYQIEVTNPPNEYIQERQAAEKKLKAEGYVNPANVYKQRLRRSNEHFLSKLEEAGEVTEDLEDKSYTFYELEKLAMKFNFYYSGANVAGFLQWLKDNNERN